MSNLDFEKISMNEQYLISKNCKMIENKDIIIIYHKLSGRVFRISKECWEIVEKCNNVCFTVQQICDACEDLEDKKYIYRLFQELIKANILVRPSEKEEVDKFKQLDIAITNKCNLECIHCCADAEKGNNDNISFDEYCQLIDVANLMNVKQIVITGGEPMICQDFILMSEYLYKNFQGIRLLMTNATLISPLNVKIIVKCFDEFNISIDGYDEKSCSIIRGKGVFKKVVDNVNLLIKNGVPAKAISLSMVETKLNYKTTEKFIQLNKQLGTNPMIREFEALGRGESNINKLVINKEEKIVDFDLSRPLFIRICSAGERRLAINSKGNIIPCMLLDNPRYYMGNIHIIENLYDYFFDEQYKETIGYDNLLNIKPEVRKECVECKYQMFCCYCLKEMEKRIDNGKLTRTCEVIQERGKILWQ